MSTECIIVITNRWVLANGTCASVYGTVTENDAFQSLLLANVLFSNRFDAVLFFFSFFSLSFYLQ